MKQKCDLIEKGAGAVQIGNGNVLNISKASTGVQIIALSSITPSLPATHSLQYTFDF